MATRAAIIPTIFSAVDKLTAPVRAMTASVERFANRSEEAIARSNRKFRALSESAFNVSKNAAAMGVAIIAPLALAAKEAVKFEDKMADVAKTTGLSGKELTAFGNDLLKMAPKTRTSVEELQAIAEIGGQLGIAQKDLLSFTNAANQFNVALGADFQRGVEEAVSSIGKIKTLFAETRDLDIASAITAAGSAINELGAVGAGTSANITDFTLRMGALPDALKSSVQNTLALGTYLEELGIDAQIGAGGLTNLLLVAGKEIDGFATQMDMSSEAAKKLLAEDPTEFVKKFATSFQGLAPEVLASKLHALKLGSQETIKVIGALGSGTARLTELQEISNKSFADATSLQAEYEKKNATTAAQMAKLKNTVNVLAINIGSALLPVINKLAESLGPIVDKVSSWMSRNPELTGTILKIVAALAALTIAISVGAFLVGVYSKGMLLLNSVTTAYLAIKNTELMLTFKVAAMYAKNLIMLGLTTAATAAWSAAQTVLNFVLTMNPIGLIIVAIAALIAAVVWITQSTTGWSETWDSAMKFMNAAIDLFVSSVKIYFLSIQHSFLTMVDGLVMAWKWGQNAIGLLSDEQYAKDKARISAESSARIAAIKTQVGIAKTAAGELSKGVDFQVKMKTDGEETPTPAMNQGAAEQNGMIQKLNGGFKSSVDINLKDPRLAGAANSPNVNVNTSKSSGGWD
jgi:TP901 family phage tail tape measure protein